MCLLEPVNLKWNCLVRKIVFFCALNVYVFVSAQHTYYSQNFESAALNCPQNWAYSGGNRTTATSFEGSYSLRVGQQGGSNTVTFSDIDVSNLSNGVLSFRHSVLFGSGPGLDTREGVAILISINGGPYIFISGISGFGDHSYNWNQTGGNTATSSGCNSYQTPNPFNYNIPAGANTISLRVVSIRTGSCGAFNSAMENGLANTFNRSDEGIYIDNISITADAPIFDIPITTYCQGATIPALPPTSINGINGSWSPSINNNSTTTYQFVPNNGECSAENITLTITPAPQSPTGLACYETATFNPTSCEWEITGTMPTEPNATNCWDDYQFDNASCSWTNNGTQSIEPNPTNCWDDYGFDNATCSWVNNGTQPTQPVIACYETAIFNSGNCSWDVTGTQPTQPNAINCWDDYQFNTTSCSWVNNGTQPTQPVIACYETATFNSGSCTWNVSGTQPAQPIAINCWDEYQFDNTQCSWVNNGVQQAEPNDLACYETTTFDTTSCSWIITGDVSNALLDVLVSPSLAEINVGQEVQLNTESTPNITNLSYTWTPALGLSCSDCANPIASPSATTTYTVFVIDQNGCQASANATVMVSENCPDLFFPTMFSPNSDGNNDYFCAFGGCISSISLKIYNRWGEVIFNASDVSECWDGKHRGKFVNNGAYVYKAQVSQTNGEPRLFSGIVTVVR